MRILLALTTILLFPIAELVAQDESEAGSLEVHSDGIGELLWADTLEKAQKMHPKGRLVENTRLQIRLGYRSSDHYYADKILRLANEFSLFFYEDKFIGLYHQVSVSQDVDTAKQEERVRLSLSDDGAIDLSALTLRVIRGQRAPFRARPVGLLLGNTDLMAKPADEYFRREDEKKKSVEDQLTLKLLGRWKSPEPEANEVESAKGGADDPDKDPFEDPRKSTGDANE